jgi:hypothetical protein
MFEDGVCSGALPGKFLRSYHQVPGRIYVWTGASDRKWASGYSPAPISSRRAVSSGWPAIKMNQRLADREIYESSAQR